MNLYPFIILLLLLPTVFLKAQKIQPIDSLHSTELSEISISSRQAKGTKQDFTPQKIEVVNIQQIEKMNAVTLDKALQNVSGITIIEKEPQIRASSGFSMGLGSRVLILLDGMPLVRADAGIPSWNLIPIESVKNIEVLKGASSVTYGPSAISGAINVNMLNADIPMTKFALYGGLYSQPSDGYLSPYSGSISSKYGASLYHSYQIHKWNIAGGIEFENNDGYRGGESNLEKTGDTNILRRQEIRMRGNINLQYHIDSNWQASISANLMYSNNNQFYFWYNAKKSIFSTFPGSLANFHDFIVYIDPKIMYTDPVGGIHTFNNRIIISSNYSPNVPWQSAGSQTIYDVYQYNKILSKKYKWNIIANLSNQYVYAMGPLFGGDKDSIGLIGTHISDNLAISATSDISILPERNLTFSLGVREEFVKINSFYETKPIFNTGINYFIPSTQTYFRGNIGQGYRPATIAERYVSTFMSSYIFFPNPHLKSETSTNMEIGIKQNFNFFNHGIEGFIDLAGYYQYYNNYIEFCFGPWNPSAANILNRYGFEFFNTGRAAIYGAELNFNGGGKITRQIYYNTNLSYTYAMPQSLDPNYAYVTTTTLPYTYATTSTNTQNNVLKYRIQHVIKGDFDFSFYKKIDIGFTIRYYSQMKNIDNFFFQLDKSQPNPPAWLILGYGNTDLPFDGLYNFMQAHKKGSVVCDVRVSYNFRNFNLSVLVNNVFNKIYALRPMTIESPRLTSLKITYIINKKM